MTIGDRICMARHLAGLTQAELAARIGVSERTVSLWETGRRVPGSHRIIGLSDACGVQPEWFFRTVSVKMEKGDA